MLIMSSQARLGNISKVSHDLGYCRNNNPNSLTCNSYLEGFKLNKLYILESTRVDLQRERQKMQVSLKVCL